MNTKMDSNGKKIGKNVKRENDGWGANVWSGGALSTVVTTVRRYYYQTRAAALAADISDEIGKSGRIK